MAKINRYPEALVEQYVKRGWWEPLSTLDYCERNARDFPEKQALVDGRNRLTWRHVKVLADRIAEGFLQLGVKRDEVVASQLPNWVEFFTVRLALFKAGVLGCHPAMTLRHREIEHILRTTGAVGIVIPRRFRNFDYLEMIDELKPRLPDLKWVIVARDVAPQGTISLADMSEGATEENDPPLSLEETKFGPYEITTVGLTSGTTEMVKLVEHSDVTQKAAARDTVERMRLTGNDIIACLAPVSGGGAQGLSVFCAPLAGAKVVLAERFEAEECFQLIEKEKATVAAVVPATLTRMLNHPRADAYDLTSLRLILYSGAPLPYPAAVAAEEKFHSPIVTRYGAIDIGNISSTSIDDPREVRLRTAGKPFSGMGVRLFDDDGADVEEGEIGEVWAGGAASAHGFFRDPEATASAWSVPGREGLARVGDLGRFDAEGNLTLVGRKKDIINRGGQNINPREIEVILLGHPKVKDVAVVGMPDSIMGEKACACVILQPGEEFDFAEMKAFFKGRKTAAYLVPERLEIVKEFPLASDQKVLKRELVKDISTKIKAEGC